MLSFERVLNELSPDLVIVVGDVNSTVACAITAKKQGIRVAHVESGLRSFDRSMPEEINRILTDSISDLLFTSEQSANINLNNEGISSDKIYFVGNTMIDSLVRQLKNAAQVNTLKNINLSGSGSDPFKYSLLTMHRPANVDSPAVLSGFLETFSSLSDNIPILFPAHPRTIKQIKENKLESLFCSSDEILFNKKGMVLIDPLGYYDMLNLMRSAYYVITDSGGIQEETTYLGIPCFTIRENTERPVTIDLGTNILIGHNRKLLFDEVSKITSGKHKKGTIPPLWDGKASERIVDTLTSSLYSR
jgi:UDP-N-acetylglucosamine 2-epimerase (non-hydrolysing)